MKTQQFHLRAILFTLLAMLTFTMTSCDKQDSADRMPKESIVGTWDIKSYKVGGDEYIGLVIEEASITFESYQGNLGTVIQRLKYPNEELQVIQGEYSINDKGKIKMEHGGELIEATVDFSKSGNSLRWDGRQDGFPLVMQADRRQ